MLSVTSNGYENVSGNCRVKSGTAKHLMRCFDPRGLPSVQFAVGEALEIGQADDAALRIDLRGNEANPPLVIASMHAARGEISWLRDPFRSNTSLHLSPWGWPPFRGTARAPRSGNAWPASMGSDFLATLFPVIATTSGTFGVNSVERASAETKTCRPSWSRRDVPLVE